VQQIIEDIRYQNADWETVSGRPVQEGDFIDVDIENMDMPGTFLCQDFRIEVKKGKVGTWLHELLIGQNVGESKDGVSRLEEGMTNAEFKPTNCRVTVKAIKASVLPPVDDALAKKVGLKNKEDLYEKVKANLEKQHKDVAHEKTRESLGQKIAEAYPFEVPFSIVSSGAQRLISERSQHLADAGNVDVKKLEEIEESTKKEVENMVRWQFITQKIAREKQVHVSKQEILTELIMEGYIDPKTGTSKARMDESPDEVMNQVYSVLVVRKVADLLLDQKK